MIKILTIKKYLADRGIKQQWLANRLNLDKSTITLKLEGKRKFYDNEKDAILEALGLPKESKDFFFSSMASVK